MVEWNLSDSTPVMSLHMDNSFDSYNRNVFGSIFASGCTISQNPGVLQIAVESGSYYYSGNMYTPSAKAYTDVFYPYYRQATTGYYRLEPTNMIDNANYDDGSGTLAPLDPGYYTKHSLYVVGDQTAQHGFNQQFFLVYGQAQYSTESPALSASLPIPPNYFTEGIVIIGSIVVQQGSTDLTLISERPLPSFNASSISGSIYHSSLLGLLHDDHTQYLLVNGTRAMSGTLNMGTNPIINATTLNGYPIPLPASYYLPSGSLALTTATPNNLDASVGASATGVANSLARSDHVHYVPTAVALGLSAASTNTAGLSGTTTLAKSDHTHAISTGITANIQPITTANFAGSLNSFARSDHTHKGVGSIQVGSFGTPDYGAITLLAGNGTSIVDSSGTITIDTIGGANELTVSSPSTNIIQWTAGKIDYNGIVYHLSAGNTTVTGSSGLIYVDITQSPPAVATVAMTIVNPSAIPYNPDAVPLATYSVSGSVTTVVDARVFLSNNLQFGLNSDITAVQAGVSASSGSTNRYADAGHTHSISTGTPNQITPNQTSSEGSSPKLARADHIHNIATAAPCSNLTATSTNFVGSGLTTTFAQSDHTHAITTGAPAVSIAPDQANGVGTSSNLARADHVHNVPTAIPSALQGVTTVATLGSSTAFARSDHTHPILYETNPSNMTPIGSSNSVGSSGKFLQSDHTHAGIHSLTLNGNQVLGDVTIVGGSGIQVSGSSSPFTINTVGGPNELSVTISGSTATYTGGKVNINGTITNITGNTFSLTGTTGAIYVDVTNTVNSNTTSIFPPGTVPMALYNITTQTITDKRVFIQTNNEFSDTAGISIQSISGANTSGTSVAFARADHVHQGVASVQANGGTTLFGAVNLAQGSNVTLGQSGNTITINSGTIAPGIAINSVGTANVVGSTGTYADAGHVHQGVFGIQANGGTVLNGTVNLTAGTNVTLGQSGNNISITSATIPAGSSIQSVGTSNVLGSTGTYADAGHVHQGVHSMTLNGNQVFGDITLLGGSGIQVTGSSSPFTINTVHGANEFAVTTSGSTLMCTGGNATIGGIVYTVPAPSNFTISTAGYLYIDGATQTVLNTTNWTNISINSILLGTYTIVGSVITYVDDRSNYYSGEGELAVQSNPTGLTVIYNGGRVNFGEVVTSILGSGITVTASTSGIIFVNSTPAVTFTAGTSTFPINCVPLATYTSTSSSVTITDKRSFINGGLLQPGTSIQSIGATNVVGSTGTYADAGHTHQGVLSVQAGAGAPIYGAVTFAGTNINVTESGSTITVTGTAPGSSINSVGVSNVVGSTGTYADAGHVHQGVLSLQAGAGSPIFGAVTLTGTNINVTESGSTITVTGTAPGSSINSVGATNVVGATGTYADAGHTHAGLSTIVTGAGTASTGSSHFNCWYKYGNCTGWNDNRTYLYI